MALITYPIDGDRPTPDLGAFQHSDMTISRGWGLLGVAFPALTVFTLDALPASVYGSKNAVTNVVAVLGAFVGDALGFLCGQ